MHVLVTGAASGIGRATCLRLARDASARGGKAKIAAVDLMSAPGLPALIDELGGLGAEALAFHGDMGDADAPARVVGEAVARLAAERDALVPLGRVATPEDMADVIAFLLGPDARYVNGHNLVADGGVSGNLLGRLPGLSQITRG